MAPRLQKPVASQVPARYVLQEESQWRWQSVAQQCPPAQEPLAQSASLLHVVPGAAAPSTEASLPPSLDAPPPVPTDASTPSGSSSAGFSEIPGAPLVQLAPTAPKTSKLAVTPTTLHKKIRVRVISLRLPGSRAGGWGGLRQGLSPVGCLVAADIHLRPRPQPAPELARPSSGPRCGSCSGSGPEDALCRT